ncbi:hypothetical protein LOD99_6316 [Oopsacas minuta]|uniref:Uncharacterized protein n=1 Tax=Oopsacas minuta TaxID=111878 RepID=A0AAV7JLW2_9METZ|nr:hypothetical protein LOD99_6316 [Oopsacas minuta]
MHRKCENDPDCFCYICGIYMLDSMFKKIAPLIMEQYYLYFGCKVGDQDKPWAPHYACHTCCNNLVKWSKGNLKDMPFGVPMVWREQRNHADDCYFCSVKFKGILKTKSRITYPNLPSALRPVAHGLGIPVPKALVASVQECVGSEPEDHFDTSFELQSDAPKLFSQEDLNESVRDLDLSKESTMLLVSRLKERNHLEARTTFYWYRNREQEFEPFFQWTMTWFIAIIFKG